MNVKDHGLWVRYVPDQIAPGFPLGTMFARRESDLADWYVYMKGEGNFGAQNVKGAARWWNDRQCYIVGPVTYGVSEIFPADSFVFELTDYTGTDPFKDFNGKVYHPENGTFEEYVPPPLPETEIMRFGPPPAFVELQAKYDALVGHMAKLEEEIKRIAQERR